MKGIAKIQLFDAASGNLISEHVEENLVTKAAEKILTLPLRQEFAGSFHSNAAVNAAYINRMLPMATELFGGVLLFRDQIPATETTFFPPKDSAPVGHAGLAYSGSSPYKGTHNDTESGVITDTSGNNVGYKHVWDFATDKANGTIGCICLTSVGGGEVGWNGYIDDASRPFNVFGIALNGGAYSPNISSDGGKLFRTNVPIAYEDGSSCFNAAVAAPPSTECRPLYMDEETGEVWYVARPASPLNASIYKIKFPRRLDVKLNTVIPAGNIEITPVYVGSNQVPVSSTYFYDGNIHSLLATSTTSITHTVYGLDGAVISSKVVPLPLPMFASGQNASHPMFFFEGHYYAYLALSEATPSTIGKFDETGALISTLGLPTTWPNQGCRVSISAALNCPIVTSNTYNSFYRGCYAFLLYGNRVIPTILQGFGEASSSKGLLPFAISSLNGDVGEGCSFSPSNTRDTRSLHICMYPGYLATINNLASPVTKTSAMTMKLVYELYDA